MDNEQAKNICLSLVKCESEDEVEIILKKNNLWDIHLWRDYGDNENNFSTIGNQQQSADKALTEKIINSVDAVLMKECLKRNISPESKEAPQSIEEAQKRFFNIPDGKLSKLSNAMRKELSNNIFVIATGEKASKKTKSPCYIIADFGEGQCPDSMPDTLLSLNKSNKTRIPFVQGKYNVGGSGVLSFCSEKHNFQLILSKRCPDIPNNNQTKDFWSFTIIRKFPPEHGFRNSIYKYLCLKDGLLRFKSKSLDILPGKLSVAYERSMEYGTFIKLYGYNLKGLYTNIKFDLYYRLSALLPEIAIPITLIETREGYKAESQTEILSGLNARLDNDKFKILENGFPCYEEIVTGNSKIGIKIYAFLRGKRDNYANKDPIIFTIDGQSHGFLPQNFFSRTKVRMDYIKNDLLLIVDCTKLTNETKEKLFLNSRDRMRDCDIKQDIESNLEDIISKHPGLLELRNRRKQEDVNEKLSESKPLTELLEKLIKKSPSLSKLLIQGSRIKNPFKSIDSNSKDNFTGMRFPTYFTLVHEFHNNKPKKIPINKKPRIQFKTDVVNDYFSRDEMSGKMIVKQNNVILGDSRYTINMWNGLCNLNVSLPIEKKVGDLIEYTVEVSDETSVKPFTSIFYLQLEPEEDKTVSNSSSRRSSSGENEGDDNFRLEGLNLPQIIKVRRNEWEKYGFNGYTSLQATDIKTKDLTFKINMDNDYLLNEMKDINNVESSILEARYEASMILIGLSIIDYYKNEEDNELIANQISVFSQCLSPYILSIISDLGAME